MAIVWNPGDYGISLGSRRIKGNVWRVKGVKDEKLFVEFFDPTEGTFSRLDERTKTLSVKISEKDLQELGISAR